jgi:ferredoxin
MKIHRMSAQILKPQAPACFAPKAKTISYRNKRDGSSVAVRADSLEFCRDKVSLPTGGSTVTVEGESTIVFLGGGGTSVPVAARKDTYILDSGLNAGLELPFTCRGGICGACVGRVAEGEVDMSDIPDLSFTMNEDEIAQGMCLLCMARPVSEKVVIETQSDWGYSLGVCEWKGPTGEILGKKVEPLMGKKWDEIKSE